MNKRVFIYCSIILSFLLLPAADTRAHGLGKQRLQQVEAGDFIISAWTDPVNNHAGEELHVTVALEDREGLVLDADVQVIATLDAEEIRATATHERAANKLQYEARLVPENAGEWRFTIQANKASREGTANFELTIEENTSTFPLLTLILVPGGAVVLFLAYRNYRNFVQSMKDKGRL